MKKLELFRSRDQEFTLLSDYIKQKEIKKSPLQILEAGCGRQWRLNLSGIQYILTGVDLDANALDSRNREFNDLDEIIIGDLHSVDLENNKYDVIYSSFVLEHIDNAEHVLNNFSKWLKPGGLLILRIPDRNSVYGFSTRVTPFWFHVFYRKYLLGFYNPYPTFYDDVVSREGIYAYCRKNNFLLKEEYGHGFYLDGRGIMTVLTRLFAKSLNCLSFGKLAWRHNNLTYVLEKS